MSKAHEDFLVSICGFFINVQLPFIGASPDGLVTCTCCGEGICEIKCPYNYKDASIASAVQDNSFCLEKQGVSDLRLKRNHTYFYQVQCQLFCTGKEYCDFIVWTKNDIFVERIHTDTAFWTTNIPKAETLSSSGQPFCQKLLAAFIPVQQKYILWTLL
jgi:hypothetical protein